jgi:hypothetical protein
MIEEKELCFFKSKTACSKGKRMLIVMVILPNPIASPCTLPLTDSKSLQSEAGGIENTDKTWNF